LAQRCQLIIARMNKGDDWVLKVRNYLLTCDSPGKSLNETAYALGVTVHTLRWHLYKNNTSYKQILLDIRMELACQYLQDTPLSLQQISYQLGYSQPANFQLAFKKYFKVPPGLWRNSREIPQGRRL
jgi:AraC-like DNA-binding protein